MRKIQRDHLNSKRDQHLTGLATWNGLGILLWAQRQKRTPMPVPNVAVAGARQPREVTPSNV
jgi:hypothetical protein